MFEIEYHTAKTISEAEIREFTALGNILRLEVQPDDPPAQAEVRIHEFKNMPDFVEVHIWLARVNHNAIGVTNMQIAHLPENQHLANYMIQILPEHRDKGLGKQFLERVLDVAKSANRSLLLTSSNDKIPAGTAFLEHFGFTPGLEQKVSQLEIAKLVTGLLEDWIKAGEIRASDYVLGCWDGAIPEDEIAAFAQLMDVMNTQPKGDLEMQDMHVSPALIRDMEKVKFGSGGKRVTSYVKHRSTGAFAGYTELEWHPTRASIISQEATGVNPEHRNLGLGKWLKAANLREMLRLNPEAKFVRTGNANTNAAMLKINVELGFKPYFTSIVWQGNTDTVLEKLQTQNASLV
jgi:mycothiol synthase